MSTLQKIFAVFVALVFGVIVYMYVQTNEVAITDTERVTAQETQVNNPESINSETYFDVKNRFLFKYSPEYGNPIPNPYTDGEYIEVRDTKGDQKFMVIASKKEGELCYLGLCEGNTIKTETVNGIAWDMVNLSECVGGCGAVSLLYRTVREEDMYYIVSWKGGEHIANNVLNTFAWQ